jgi:predicted nucleic acid-binding Zn ribbon protein
MTAGCSTIARHQSTCTKAGIAATVRRSYIAMMQTFLVLLLIAAMIATVVALVRGIIAFLQQSSAQVKSGEAGPHPAALKSNKMMQQRIFFQAIAVLIVVVLLFAAGRT